MWRRTLCLLISAVALACEPPPALTIYPDDSGASVTLRWRPADCPSYRLWYSGTPNGASPTILANVFDTVYVTTVTVSKRFFYVTSVDSDSNQSAPSNVVGFVRISCPANPAPGIQTVSTPFGLPFKFWGTISDSVPLYGLESTRPRHFAAGQPNCTNISTHSDRILRADNGFAAFRLTQYGCSYVGALETDPNWYNRIVPGRSYFYQNRTDAARHFVIAGQIDTSGIYAPSPESVTLLHDVYFNYSWRDSRSLPYNHLNLLASGLTDFRVVAQDGSGNNFAYRDGQWHISTLTAVEPGQAYWIQNRGATASYDYDASGDP